MRSTAETVAEYLAELTPERREGIQRLRLELKRHLDPLLEEVMQYGMITYVVPHRVYPPGYHCRPTDPLPFLSLASQKNNLALYVMAISMDRQLSAWLDKAWQATGHRLDRGESCIRFRSPDEIPFDVLAGLLRQLNVPNYLQIYEESRRTSANKPKASAKKGVTRPLGRTTVRTGNPPPGQSREIPPAGSARRGKSSASKRTTPAARDKQTVSGKKSPKPPPPGKPRRSGRS